MRPPKMLIAAAVVILTNTATAFGHPIPKTASPAPKTILSTSPAEIRIGFTERLVSAFSGLELHDANDHAVALGPSTVNPNDEKEMFAQIKVPLASGVYTVMWHAVGGDTHRVKGHYSFQVKP